MSAEGYVTILQICSVAGLALALSAHTKIQKRYIADMTQLIVINRVLHERVERLERLTYGEKPLEEMAASRPQ